jgi:hypothetical protein
MKKIVSFSLWGDSPKYCVGAVRNAELMETMYPGWTARFYCGESVPAETTDKLVALGSEVVRMGVPGDWTGMFWRFEAISDPDVEIMISRDTDSRLSKREVFAVNDWLLSGKSFHIMRDHPAHNTVILGGMWGARKPVLQDMKNLIDSYIKQSYWQIDQQFLRDIVWPRVMNDSCVHDPFFQKIPFPVSRNGLEFVGQVWDENENTVEEHLQELRKHIP